MSIIHGNPESTSRVRLYSKWSESSTKGRRHIPREEGANCLPPESGGGILSFTSKGYLQPAPREGDAIAGLSGGSRPTPQGQFALYSTYFLVLGGPDLPPKDIALSTYILLLVLILVLQTRRATTPGDVIIPTPVGPDPICCHVFRPHGRAVEVYRPRIWHSLASAGGGGGGGRNGVCRL